MLQAKYRERYFSSPFSHFKLISVTNVRSDAVIILNVNGDIIDAGGFALRAPDQSLLFDCHSTVWNFYEATSITFASIHWL
jgi:choice-of-anchor A domain-containing protein